MIVQSEGKIFLAEERGCEELHGFRTYHSFNFGNYRKEGKQAIGPLYVLNDDTLEAGGKLSMLVEEASDIIIIPLVGAIDAEDGKGNYISVEAGEAAIIEIAAGASFTLQNPYEDAVINFLQLWIRGSAVQETKPSIYSFNIDRNKDRMIHICIAEHYHLKIGKFNGRAEVQQQVAEGKTLFMFVVAGAFEVQYRLLQPRDGLALWNVDEVEVEALSNDAIILSLEFTDDQEVAHK